MPSTLAPGLVVAHSHRLEDLTAVAVKLMQAYPLAPLEEETVLVQSNGIAQWLKIELAKASGIAAMLHLTLPARFVWKAYRAVLGDDIPKNSPFDKDRLSWRIMRLLPTLLAEHHGRDNNVFLTLENYLSAALSSPAGAAERNAATKTAEINERKLFQLSARIADLFDQYQNYRADWLDHWTQGRFCLNTELEPLDADSQWQPLLWQALVRDIGADLFWTNRAELHRQFVTKAKQLSAPPVGLPRRLVIFGISSLPQQTLEVLDALKGCMQIVLCVHNPCMHYWANIVDGKEALKAALQHANKQRHRLKAGMSEDTHDDTLHLHAHPLLASWGKQGRDYIHLLDLYDETLEKQGAFAGIKFEIFDETPARNRLQQLQSDVLQLRPVQETRSLWQVEQATQPDNSIAFHICHSIQREVEVLHDQLLAAFEQDSTLEPRHIMVMVPDVNAYAPHIDAVFGRFVYNDQRRIPYTIADQGQRHMQPLLVALEQLLTIDQSRISQADILSLLGVPAIQQRFDLNAQDLLQIQQWFDAAGARWGLNAEQRSQFGMPQHESTNSWWFALERMVFGYAMGRPQDDTQLRWHDVEPYHEIGGLAADAVGKLGLMIEVLNTWWTFAQGTYTYHDWVNAAQLLMARVFKPANDNDLTLLGQLHEQLDELLAVVAESDFTAPLTLATFRESWLARVDQPNLNQRFLAGSVNFATLMPMRAIPFKHIYILGMSDDAYPRRQSAIDFDLMRAQYRPGDRSRRDDDRYLFLEALLSARDKFYLSWVGRSAQDNSEWPPSVLVAQLREHLVKGWCPSTVCAKQFLAALTTEHKLQAFHPDYMTAGTGLFTYAAEWQAARTLLSEPNASVELKPWTPEQEQRLQLNLRSLVNFMREPAQPFFNQRLNTYFRSDETQTQDSETFTLDNLQQWQLSNELLHKGVELLGSQLSNGSFAVLDSLDPLQPVFAGIFSRLQREGALGIGVMSDGIQETALARISAQLIEVSKQLQGWQPIADEPLYFEGLCAARLLGSDAELHENTAAISMVIEDRATQLFQNDLGEVLQLFISASECSAKHRFLPYLKHLILSAVRDKKPQLGNVLTLAVFRKGKDSAQLHVLPAINANAARKILTRLLALYVQSLSKPTGVVGELAVDWLDCYLKVLSGSKPTIKGVQSTPPASEAEAKEAAADKVRIDVAKNDSAAKEPWPYAARVEHTVELMLQSDDFASLCEQLYSPMIRLESGQHPHFELPEARYGQDNSSKQGGEQ